MLAVANVPLAIAALGDPTRRAVFERLRDGPRTVGELADGMPVTRSAVSQHLRVLGDAGLVTQQRAGTRRLYRVQPDGLAALRAYFDELWGAALGTMRVLAESDESEEEGG
jgi:DNA-binding transcriptional ArsR family regulator